MTMTRFFSFSYYAGFISVNCSAPPCFPKEIITAVQSTSQECWGRNKFENFCAAEIFLWEQSRGEVTAPCGQEVPGPTSGHQLPSRGLSFPHLSYEGMELDTL